MKRHYEQFALVAGELADDLAGALPPEQFRRFQALRRHAEWLLAFVLHLRDYVTQVREAYQAQIDIEQNQIMKIFTVLTAVFLPLSLIVGWYGMNFEMPEYRWELGYAFVILLSAAVCVFCIWFFRRKRWF
ncbi:MAG: Magnesium transport protein CorA [Firmicutes bacterium ADurb.Bin467]|nr:MAG: Magnesium transport protein CorA [Firmicutes bacterium ADurb.Bin467]